MAKYLLTNTNRKGTAQIILHNGERVTLASGQKVTVEIQSITKEQLNFYKNYRSLGITFNPIPNQANTSGIPSAHEVSLSQQQEIENQREVQKQEEESNLTKEELMKKTKPELIAYAKDKGKVDIDVNLSKEQIISIILG